MGDRAYKILSDYKDQLQGAVVEIGSENPREYCPDGFGEGSTRFLSTTSKATGFPFYTVDFDPAAYEQVSRLPGVSAFHMKGEEFLENEFPRFGHKIGFAYLDNYDWSFNGYSPAKTPDSLDPMEINNANSQRAHLDQAILVSRYAEDRCIIVFDDTWRCRDGSYSGRGGTAVPHLLANGFELLHLHRFAVSVARGVRRSLRVEVQARSIRMLKTAAMHTLPTPLFRMARGRFHQFIASRN